MNTHTALDLGSHSPIPFTDEDGLSCYRVPLGLKGYPDAIIEVEDYHYLIDDLRITPIWTRWGDGDGREYVAICAYPPGREKYLAILLPRLLLDAGAGECIGYMNGDGKDLRRSNLELRPGPSRYSATEWLEAVQRARMM